MPGFWLSCEKNLFSTDIALYFVNNTVYGYSYNEGRIRSRVRSIEGYHF